MKIILLQKKFIFEDLFKTLINSYLNEQAVSKNKYFNDILSIINKIKPNIYDNNFINQNECNNLSTVSLCSNYNDNLLQKDDLNNMVVYEDKKDGFSVDSFFNIDKELNYEDNIIINN